MSNLDLHPRSAADEAWQNAQQSHTGNGADPDTATLTPLEYVVASSRAGHEPLPRPWLVRDWIPRRQVTLLTGEGGVGKSLLALQLMVGTALTGSWLRLPAMRCRSWGLFAEDEDGEIEHRLNDVAKLLPVDRADLGDLAYRSAVADPCELVEITADSRFSTTEYYERLRLAVLQFQARLVVLDAAANLYGGDELRRRQVNHFLLLLRRLAIEIDGAVLLLAHPSAHGISSGTGYSGVTHWHNGVRSRLYQTHATGENADPDERVLTQLKNNYAAGRGAIRMRWQKGGFIAIGDPIGIDRVATSAKAERVFLALLRSTYQTGMWVSPNMTARNYAPHVFGKHTENEQVAKSHFETVMTRLVREERVKIETYGRPSDLHTRLVPVAQS